MFSILKSAVKATTSVIDIPASAVADVFSMGDVLKEGTNTEDALKRLKKNLQDISDPEK